MSDPVPIPASAHPSDGARSPSRILAIDGPAGAGKSTVAARVAEQFRLLNIETGAMYRAFALKALQQGTAPNDGAALSALCAVTSIELLPGNRVILDGADVTAQLRAPKISAAASEVSVHAGVRASLVQLQQAMRGALPPGIEGIAMEGRDIGTVVFPDAGIKIFLFASPEARTGRRLAQSSAAGAPSRDTGAVLAALEARDRRDASRTESPLRPAEDAIRIDSTELTLDEVVEQVAALVRERWGLTRQV